MGTRSQLYHDEIIVIESLDTRLSNTQTNARYRMSHLVLSRGLTDTALRGQVRSARRDIACISCHYRRDRGHFAQS